MKTMVVIFDRPVILPGDGLVPVETFGYVFPKTDLATPVNDRAYIKYYVLVLAELFKDKTIEFIGKQYYKKDGKVFFEDDEIWEQYKKQAEQVGIQFAILEIEDTEVSPEEMYEDYLLTSKERWEQLKERDDVEWQV